jgi:hypothetical protein
MTGLPMSPVDRRALLRVCAETDSEFVVAEVARLWPLDVEETKLWRVRLHRVNAGIIPALILKGPTWI